MSSRLYSQLVAGVTVEVTVTKLGTFALRLEEEAITEELVDGVNRSLLFSGSSAD